MAASQPVGNVVGTRRALSRPRWAERSPTAGGAGAPCHAPPGKRQGRRAARLGRRQGRAKGGRARERAATLFGAPQRGRRGALAPSDPPDKPRRGPDPRAQGARDHSRGAGCERRPATPASRAPPPRGGGGTPSGAREPDQPIPASSRVFVWEPAFCRLFDLPMSPGPDDPTVSPHGAARERGAGAVRRARARPGWAWMTQSRRSGRGGGGGEERLPATRRAASRWALRFGFARGSVAAVPPPAPSSGSRRDRFPAPRSAMLRPPRGLSASPLCRSPPRRVLALAPRGPGALAPPLRPGVAPASRSLPRRCALLCGTLPSL